MDTFSIIRLIILILLISSAYYYRAGKNELEKGTGYECGYEVIEKPNINNYFVRYYIIGILFLLFDLEVLLIYPLTVNMGEITLGGYLLGYLIVIIIYIGVIIELNSSILL